MSILARLASILIAAMSCLAVTARTITATDLWQLRRVQSPRVSPDGRTVAYTVQAWSIEKNAATSSIWLVDLASGRSRALTSGHGTDASPAWSPDGKQIAFVSKRDGDETNALYTIPVDGGEAEKVVELPYAISSPEWLAQGQSLVFVTSVITNLAGDFSPAAVASLRAEVRRRQGSKVTAKATENRFFRYWNAWRPDDVANRLVRIDLPSRKLTDLTPGFDHFFSLSGSVSMDVSPDGKNVALALVSSRPPYRDYPNSDIYLVPTDGSGRLENLTADNPHGDNQPRFSSDGKSVLFGRLIETVYAGESTKLFRHDFATGLNSRVAGDVDLSFEDWHLSEDGRLIYFLAEQQGEQRIFRIAADGTGLVRLSSGSSTSDLQLTRAGSLIFIDETLQRPPELYIAEARAGEPRALTHTNDAALAKFEFGRSTSETFKGAAGDNVQAWLVFPPGFDQRHSYPLVHLMHGGPHSMVRNGWDWRWNAEVFAAQGYVVACLNRHGSTGFGEKFARSVIDEWGPKPFEDIMRGTDYLLAKYPNLDPHRMAAAGPSFGGYLAAYILGHTDRFACLVDHGGVNDLFAQYGSDIPWVFAQTFGGQPWRNPEAMRASNPVAAAANFRTPTLITQGEADYRVPVGQALELYGILQAMGVPSKLVIYPGEIHWILTPQNSIHWYGQVADWLARYLHPAADAASEVVKP
jgi:dipeptidyl aminopeptidase/acylaminoacyl peptidase